MGWDSKVLWAEGLFLQPHHFQRADRYTESFLAGLARRVSPYVWGVNKLEIDQEVLKFGQATRDSVTGALSQVQLIPTGQPTPTSPPYAGPIPFLKAFATHALTQSHVPTPAIRSTMMQDDFRMLATSALPEGRDMRALFDLSPALWSASGVMAQV